MERMGEILYTCFGDENDWDGFTRERSDYSLWSYSCSDVVFTANFAAGKGNV